MLSKLPFLIEDVLSCKEKSNLGVLVQFVDSFFTFQALLPVLVKVFLTTPSDALDIHDSLSTVPFCYIF